jgi:P4 family phage/plasmid primase-like protien
MSTILRCGKQITQNDIEDVRKKVIYLDDDGKPHLKNEDAADHFRNITDCCFVYGNETKTSGAFYRWEEIMWVPYSQIDIYADAMTVFGFLLDKINPRNEFCEALKIKSSIHRNQFTANRFKLYLKNVAINPVTMKTEAHNPDNYNLSVVDTEYVIGATCPKWQKCLEDWFGEYDDDGKWVTNKDMIALVQEFVGYALTPSCELEAAMFLEGTGANGKSVFLDTVVRLFGESAVSFSLSQFARQFDVELLNGKLLAYNTDDEISSNQKIGNVIKKFASGEPLRGERKFGDVYQFKNYAKGIWAVNNVPSFEEKSYGTERRIIAIPFNRDFITEGIADITFKQKMVFNLSGVLNWAIEGLERLFKRQPKKFMIPKAVSDNSSAFMELNDTVRQWFTQSVERKVGSKLLKCDAYDHFVKYCEQVGYKREFIPTANSFWRSVKRNLRIKAKQGHNGERYYADISTLNQTVDGVTIPVAQRVKLRVLQAKKGVAEAVTKEGPQQVSHTQVTPLQVS